MAFTPPPPGSIASRPTVSKGGVRSVDESPDAFSQRMARRQASTPAPTGMTPAAPTRRDNILAARADGSFATKRSAFNAGTAQHGQTMDEAGTITGTATATAPAPKGQLVPGRSTGSMVFQPATPAPATASPAPSPASMTPATPATPGMAPPPPKPMVPGTASPITPAGTGPLRPTATTPGQTTALMGRLNTSMDPPPPSGATPTQPAASAPAVAQPPPRKVGRINDGQGYKPASEVNTGLRAAQEARATQPMAPPPPKPAVPASTTPGVLNQAAVDAHWTPERRAASRKEEKRLMDEQEAARMASSTPKPKLKTDAEYAEQHRINAELAAINQRQKQREQAARSNKPSAPARTVRSSAADIPGISSLLVAR